MGYSSTAENTAARKAFLVRFRVLFCSGFFFSFFSIYLVRRVERDRPVKEFGGYNSVFKYTYEKFTILFSCVTACHQPSLCVISHNNIELNINEQPWADPGQVTWVRIHPPPPFREVVLSFIDFVSFIFSYTALVTNLTFPESLPQNRHPPPILKILDLPLTSFCITRHNYTLLPITGLRHLFFRDNFAASHEGLLRFQFVTKNVVNLLLGYTEQSRS